jgi:RNA polymerase sigma-70 factor (ECF subfamily)
MRALYNAAYRILGNEHDASDVTQAVFLRVLERIEEYDSQYRFFSWIYRIAVNEAIDLLRRKRREEPIEDETLLPDPGGTDPQEQYSARQRARQLQGALMKLKTEDRVVLTLRHFSELSYAEIAGILNLEEKTVKSRLFEARRRLATILLANDAQSH